LQFYSQKYDCSSQNAVLTSHITYLPVEPCKVRTAGTWNPVDTSFPSVHPIEWLYQIWWGSDTYS